MSQNRNETTKHNEYELKTICCGWIFIFLAISFVNECNQKLGEAQGQAKGTDDGYKKKNLLNQYLSYVFSINAIVVSRGKVSMSNYFRPMSS